MNEPEGPLREPRSSRYREAGVDIDAKYETVRRAEAAIRSTFRPGVVSDIGLFGGVFDLAGAGREGELLVASTDGVGTKLLCAIRSGRYETVGQDLVHHCINDILVQGARPLFFLDYVGTGAMQPDAIGEVLLGVARACQGASMALLGGETAEMPGLYREGDFDLVGTIVGSVPRERLLDGSRVREGDVVLSLPSNGLHTNGYSLARKVLLEEAGLALEDRPDGLGESLADALLRVHRSYLDPVLPVLTAEDGAVHACAHITGGGVIDNLPRVLPEGLGAEIRPDAVDVPAICRLIVERGGIESAEAYRVFNMGFGFLLLVDPDRSRRVTRLLEEAGEDVRDVGRIVSGIQGVRLVQG